MRRKNHSDIERITEKREEQKEQKDNKLLQCYKLYTLLVTAPVVVVKSILLKKLRRKLSNYKSKWFSFYKLKNK